MKHLIFAVLFISCAGLEKGVGPGSGQPAPLGYSLGLGCQGMCLGDTQATEVMVGRLDRADTSIAGLLIFGAGATVSVFIPDSLRILYWNNASFMAAVAVNNRTAVRLPDHRLDIVRDSCLTWEQSAFPEPVPCIPILAIRP